MVNLLRIDSHDSKISTTGNEFLDHELLSNRCELISLP